jgi:hypothetical protein
VKFALIAVAAIAIGGWALRPQGGSATDRGYVVSLANPSISESSGVAVSRRDSNVFWTHNDSGDSARFFAFDLKGRDLGTYTLAGAEAVDWEDIASGKVGGKPYLYLGDIGDNRSRRSSIRIYRVAEPKVGPGEHSIQQFETYTCTYPDGAHNCETLLVTPNGDIQLVTKSEDGRCGVYYLAKPRSSGSFVLRRIGELRLEGDPFRKLATGGDISADGESVVIRTYFSALLFRGKSLMKWFEAKPTVLEMPMERQGEGICFDLPNGRFITTSEGNPCRVSFARIPR